MNPGGKANPAIPPFPSPQGDGKVDAADLLAHYAASALAADVACSELFTQTRQAQPGVEHIIQSLLEVAAAVTVGGFIAVHLLRALRRVDPAAADAAATELVALRGEAFGELLWDWAVEAGVDAVAVASAAMGQQPPPVR